MKILIVFTLFVIPLLLPSPIQAARKRVPRGSHVYVSTQAVGAICKPRLRVDRRALQFTCSSFGQLASGSYELTYTANGVGQGAGGSIILGDTSTKELLFGTCSGGICTYHTGITNAYFKITSRLQNGSTVVKPYRIKV